MKFEIKNRWSGELIFSIETTCWKLAVEAAIKSKANLSEANLSEANLSEANLSEADLSWADLSKANLSEADLSWADLSEADLSKADLSKANLSEANLSEADLSWANLSEADLSWANLSEADLSKADLSKANLSEADLSWADLSKANLSTIRNDFWAVLLFAKKEVSALRQSIIDGKIDGSVYVGECACLVGTIAKAKSCTPEALPLAIRPNSGRHAERFFMGIQKGDTPEKNPVSKIALEWIDEWLKQMEVEA